MQSEILARRSSFLVSLVLCRRLAENGGELEEGGWRPNEVGLRLVALVLPRAWVKLSRRAVEFADHTEEALLLALSLRPVQPRSRLFIRTLLLLPPLLADTVSMLVACRLFTAAADELPSLQSTSRNVGWLSLLFPGDSG